MADTFESVVADIKALTAKEIARTAIAENARIMADPPRPLGMVRHVDGVEGAPETAVREGGVIVYDYNRLDQVADVALDTLRQLSPFDSGDYVRSHVLMLNGNVVASLAGWRRGDRVTISNLMPYTRKIEIGKGGYRRHAHVYEKAASLVARRFGNQARVTFIYDKAPRGGGDAGITAWAWNKVKIAQAGMAAGLAANPRAQQLGMKAAPDMRHHEWLMRQPTLLIGELS
jgi:hypothetical protein